MNMRVRFWGTRGSLPRPGPGTLRYGGNTSCVEVRGADGTMIVLDCGTGAHDLGRALLAEAGGQLHGHLLISHTHWDHIQGFPFFAPLFVTDYEWDVYAPKGVGQRLEATLAGQMEFQYFPVSLKHLGATVRYHDLTEGTFAVGGVRVTARYLNHPGLTMGYRLESAGSVVVYATDHEPHSRHQPEAPGAGVAPVHAEDRRHVEFLAGADLVIHDAQYTLAEYPTRLTWGHSPAEWAVDFAAAAGVKRLALFHHDPARDDDAVEALLAACRQRARNHGAALEVFAAAEGQIVEIASRASIEFDAGGPQRDPDHDGPPTILIADDDVAVLEVLSEALASEGFRVLGTGDGAGALALARAEHPDLLLLDWNMPGMDGLDVCRAIRTDPDVSLRSVPVILITGRDEPEDTAASFGSGISDYLTKPFKTSLLLARVHAWLLRRR